MLNHLIDTIANKFPNNTAIIFNDNEITYQQLNTKVKQLAYWMQQQNIQIGDRVLFFFDDSSEKLRLRTPLRNL